MNTRRRLVFAFGAGALPFEQPTRYYLEISRKTANALGVKITPELLLRADKVIK